MSPTKQIPADFKPGNSYRRENDGMLMVEIAPGQFVSQIVALGLGIKPRTGEGNGKAKT